MSDGNKKSTHGKGGLLLGLVINNTNTLYFFIAYYLICLTIPVNGNISRILEYG